VTREGVARNPWGIDSALTATADLATAGQRVIAEARAAVVRRIGAAVHCTSLDEDGLVEHLDRVAKSHDRAIAEAEERGARAMHEVVEARLRYVCEQEEGGAGALLGLRLALAEMPPLAQEAVVRGIVARAARERGER
jgi:hypothetical protein